MGFRHFFSWLSGSCRNGQERTDDGSQTPADSTQTTKNSSTATSTLKTSPLRQLKTGKFISPKLPSTKLPSAKLTSAKLPSTKLTSVLTDKGHQMPVRLNVYSLEKANAKLRFTGFGIYHSGVEVHSTEWAFGGHPQSFSGIFRMVHPRDLKSLSDIEGSFKFAQTLRVGYTTRTLEEIEALLVAMGKTWQGDQYHLLYRNCNHFADLFCRLLCGHGIPEWINRGATIMRLFPFIVDLIPAEYLMPKELAGLLDKKMKKEREEGEMGEREEETSTATASAVVSPGVLKSPATNTQTECELKTGVKERVTLKALPSTPAAPSKAKKTPTPTITSPGGHKMGVMKVKEGKGKTAAPKGSRLDYAKSQLTRLVKYFRSLIGKKPQSSPEPSPSMPKTLAKHFPATPPSKGKTPRPTVASPGVNKNQAKNASTGGGLKTGVVLGAMGEEGTPGPKGRHDNAKAQLARLAKLLSASRHKADLAKRTPGKA